MSFTYIEPTADSVQELLAMLFGDALTVVSTEPEKLSEPYVATYINMDGDVVAVCACDISLVARAGAAFSMVPADVAEESINGEEVSDIFRGNFHELMNICSKLMMSDDSDYLKLEKTLVPAENSARIVAAMVGANAFAFTVNIPEYGDGVMIFYVGD